MEVDDGISYYNETFTIEYDESPYMDIRLDISNEQRSVERKVWKEKLDNIRQIYGYWNFTDKYINSNNGNDDDDNNNDEEHSYTSNDDDASFYTSDASSHQPIARRRGRSPTVKEGYNSDGESLRSRSTCSRGSFWTDTNNTMDKSVESASHNSVDVTVIDSLEQGGDANFSISSRLFLSPMAVR